MWRRKNYYESGDSGRRNRGLTQNLFLIETIPSDEQYTKQFVVMGSTGNVYTVTITNQPTCTCPDHITREANCKHIYFILLKVMKVDIEDEQDYFSNEELEDMFTNIPRITSNLIVNSSLRHLYRQKMGETELEENKEENSGKVEKKPTNDICPICLEDLEDGNPLDYCKYGCGKSIHTQCFTMWCKKNSKTCVFCRTEWDKKINKIDDEYINLIKAGGVDLTVHIDDLSRDRIHADTELIVVESNRVNHSSNIQPQRITNNSNIDMDTNAGRSVSITERREKKKRGRTRSRGLPTAVEEVKEEEIINLEDDEEMMVDKSAKGRINKKAYNLFSEQQREILIKDRKKKLNNKDILKEISSRWAGLTEKEKKKYEKLAEKENKKKMKELENRKKEKKSAGKRKQAQSRSKSVDKRGKGGIAAKRRKIQEEEEKFDN